MKSPDIFENENSGSPVFAKNNDCNCRKWRPVSNITRRTLQNTTGAKFEIRFLWRDELSVARRIVLQGRDWLILKPTNEMSSNQVQFTGGRFKSGGKLILGTVRDLSGSNIWPSRKRVDFQIHLVIFQISFLHRVLQF